LSRTLNLGILAHVDAGKTTLTERLLYATGVIDAPGSVDAGTTQTDSLALERQRGITIKSAVVSFVVDDVVVNLIDTPGHPDFIAEVDRALSVLDGAVLVVSAVEGVQPQTRLLLRALRRLRVPTLVFVNKIDRAGADGDRVPRAIADRLTPAIVAMGSTRDAGTRAAEFVPFDGSNREFALQLTQLLAEHDRAMLEAFVDRDLVASPAELRAQLARQTSHALVHPVFFGSAITGAGVASLIAALVELLPARARDTAAPVSARVFKIERGDAGERIAFVRMFSGCLRVRDRVRVGDTGDEKVTAIEVFADGGTTRDETLSAGRIGKVTGLGDVRIGDALGAPPVGVEHQFGPPTLETVVVPTDPKHGAALRTALAQLAEQDPLITVRQDDERREITVSLYGEVQKEVIAATLAADFGIAVTFRSTTVVYIERPAATGAAVELLEDDDNPYAATVGLRIEPALPGAGVTFQLDVDTRAVPTYIYGTHESFVEHMTRYVGRALLEGLRGWEVTDCDVTMTDCRYYVGDGRAKPTRPTPRTKASDFRKLTPRVVHRALQRAGTRVCEPIVRADIEAPSSSLGVVLAFLARLGGTVDAPLVRGDLSTVTTTLPAARVQELRRQLSHLTSGEGVVETTFAGYEPVTGTPPTRTVRA
jgi:ribosomal protection tetracycline resistance protein